jgi:polyhydroxyalkanoate synthesis repressor PhaR
MSDPRTIKKYPNRRLYDTVESRYITLGDVRKLVLDRIDFIVVDKKTQADITSGILLQVIAEQEHGDPLMSRDFLSQIIRSYGGGAMQGVIACYLEQSLKLFVNEQREMRDRAKSICGADPKDTAAIAVQKNYQRWRTVQDEIFRTLMDAAPRAHADDTAHSGA